MCTRDQIRWLFVYCHMGEALMNVLLNSLPIYFSFELGVITIA